MRHKSASFNFGTRIDDTETSVKGYATLTQTDSPGEGGALRVHKRAPFVYFLKVQTHQKSWAILGYLCEFPIHSWTVLDPERYSCLSPLPYFWAKMQKVRLVHECWVGSRSCMGEEGLEGRLRPLWLWEARCCREQSIQAILIRSISVSLFVARDVISIRFHQPNPNIV
jgi:hypothetical protein